MEALKAIGTISYHSGVAADSEALSSCFKVAQSVLNPENPLPFPRSAVGGAIVIILKSTN